MTEGGAFCQANWGQRHPNAANNSSSIFNKASGPRWDGIENRKSGLLRDAHQLAGGLNGVKVKSADPRWHQNQIRGTCGRDGCSVSSWRAIEDAEIDTGLGGFLQRRLKAGVRGSHNGWIVPSPPVAPLGGGGLRVEVDQSHRHTLAGGRYSEVNR
jgi:hypothetical protein